MILGDLDDSAALAALTAGTDVVIHAAGLIKALDRAAFFAINEGGAARVAQAVAASPGARMIQISSLAAREPSLSDYAASKRAGEAAAKAVLGERLMVLRPPAIYGPGDRETLGLFQLAGGSPAMPVPDAPGARLALAFVDDVAAFVMAAMERPWGPGTFAHGGARPAGYGWREIFETAAAAMGRSPAFVPLPPWIIGAAGAAASGWSRATGRAAIFGVGKAREILHPDWSVSPAEQPPASLSRPASTELSLRAGFDATVAWYRQAGWLPGGVSDRGKP